MAQVAGEGGQVVGGVAQGQHLGADPVADPGAAEVLAEGGWGDDRELLQDVPVEVGGLRLLACDVVERY